MTLKLYYAPGACSLAPHIILCESELTFTTEKVDLKSKKTASGKDFLTINPKGYVPVLELEDGQMLTEVAVILQYIGDRVLGAGLIGKHETMERYRQLEWLNFIGSEVHKKMGAFFQSDLPDAVKKSTIEMLSRRFSFLETNLKKSKYLMGENFTLPDAYLFTVLRWAPYLKIDLKPYPAINQYVERVSKLPCVHTALVAEDLLK